MQNLFDNSQIRDYAWGELHSIKHQNDLSFNAFSRIIIMDTLNVEELHKNLKKEIEQDDAFKELDPRDHGLYYSAMYEWEEWLQYNIKLRKSYSSLLLIYSYFESQLLNLYNIINKEFKIKDLTKDKSRSSYMKQYWAFINKDFGINKKNIEPF